jgi:hypothetical protein
VRPRVFITQPVAGRAPEKLSARADVVCNRDGSRVLPKADLMLAMKDYLMAWGLMGEPTAPVMGSGGATNMNS